MQGRWGSIHLPSVTSVGFSIPVGTKLTWRLGDWGHLGSPSACQPAHPPCFPWLHHLLSAPRHVANERPILTSLGHQLGFFHLPRLIMPLSLVPFWQLMYLCVHKRLFVFNLSDVCAATLSCLGPRLSLSCRPFLTTWAVGRVLVLSDRPMGQASKLEGPGGELGRSREKGSTERWLQRNQRSQGTPEGPKSLATGHFHLTFKTHQAQELSYSAAPWGLQRPPGHFGLSS